MSLYKHSERTVRKGCRKCGRSDLYWAHDADNGHDYCSKCKITGRWAMIERDGSLHACFANGEASDQTPATSDVADVAADDVKVPVPAVPAESNGHRFGGVSTDKSAAATQLADLIGSLARGTVDEAQVEAMINGKLEGFAGDMIETVGRVVSERVARITVPTVVEVKREDSEPKVIKGAHKTLPMILRAAAMRINTLMVGPMGTGKSTIARHVAEALSIPFMFMAVGPQTSKSDIVGYMTADGTYVPSLFRKVYEAGGVFLFDEFDAAHPGVFTLVNAALANGHMAFPDGMIERHPDTVIMAAANTYGRGPDRMYVGRQALDAATLDRFAIVEVGVDEALETSMAYSTGLDVAAADSVLTYVRTLRRNAEASKMAVGFSPRASYGMCQLLACGWSVKDAIEGRVRRGLSEQDWSKVSSGAVAPRL